MEGVTFTSASGSVFGSSGGASSLWRAWCQPNKAMPAMRNSTLNTVQVSRCPGGVLPTSSSCGQLLV